MLIRTEQTPNPATRKFLPEQIVMEAGTRDFPDAESAEASPLASALFSSGMVEGVFYGRDFISVTAAPGVSWGDLEPLVLETLLDHFVSGAPLFAQGTAAGILIDGCSGHRGGSRGRGHHRPDQGTDRNARSPRGRPGRRRHRLSRLSRRPALSRHAGRLLRLPVFGDHPEARHRKPHPPLRARGGIRRSRLIFPDLPACRVPVPVNTLASR